MPFVRDADAILDEVERIVTGRKPIPEIHTVLDLVAGSGLAFEDAGEHELKGVPNRWRLYRVPA